MSLVTFAEVARMCKQLLQCASGVSSLNNSHIAGTIYTVPEHGVDTALYPRYVPAGTPQPHVSVLLCIEKECRGRDLVDLLFL